MLELKNKFIEISLFPELGGRILRFSLSGENCLFENPALAGVENIQPTEKWDGKWLNYGGEKIWPAPQGWDAPEREWCGPPDPYIDGGIYKVIDSGEDFITLESPTDPVRGIKIRRNIKLLKDEARIKISAELFNLSGVSKRWSIWPVAQMAQTSGNCEASVPVGGSAWRIMHGVVNNPQYSLDGDILRINYMRIVGKVGALAPAGWASFSDLSAGRVFAASFDFNPAADYPDSTSVQVWTSGIGSVFSRGKLRTYPESEAENPPYTELELLSPLSEIPAGGSCKFDYCLGACKTAKGESVKGVSQICATTVPLQKTSDGGFKFGAGFFKEGKLSVVALRGAESETILESDCTPLSPVFAKGEIPSGTAALSVKFSDNYQNSKTIDSIRI